MKLTVGICTWNRAKHLDITLVEMQSLRVPAGIEWDILVANNNSTDDTAAVIEKHAKAGRLPVRALFEAKQGKSHACNLLVKEAKGEWILWTDDDVRVAPDWIERYVDAIRACPAASFFGGTIEPLYENTPPAWVTESLSLLEGPYALAERGEDVRPMGKDEFPYGANMAIRTDLMQANPFDGKLGPTGNKLLRGEDIRLIENLKEKGHQGVWVGTAKVKHLVPASRMTRQYIWNWFFTGGETAAGEKVLPGPRLFGMPRWIVRQYLEARLGWHFGRFASHKKRINWWRTWAYNAGMLAECRRKAGGEITNESVAAGGVAGEAR